jgi:Immunity protein Imm1
VGVWTLLHWGRETTAGTLSELEEAILAIPKDALTPNTIVDIAGPNSDMLSIGIAGPWDGYNSLLHEDVAYVEYSDASQEPPYLRIVGDRSLCGEVVFMYRDRQHTPEPRHNCVPVEMMLRVVRHLYEYGTLPDWVEWEEV